MINIVEEFPGENDIVIGEDIVRDFQAHIEVKGRDNRVVIHRPGVCIGLHIEVNGGGSVEIGEACVFHDQHIRLFAPGRVSVGSGSAFNGNSVIHICLILDFDGAILSTEWREALWARFCMGAPRRQRQSVEQYKVVKRA